MVHEPTRILIVDDSRIFRGFLEKAFAKNAEVVVAGSVFNGEKAIEFLKKSPVDLVTLDLEMPGLDGLSTLKAIRALNRSRPSCPPIEVLLISSLTTQGARCTVEGLQLGAIDFVLKPSGGTETENMAALQGMLTEKLQVYQQKRYGKREPIALRSDPRSLRGNESRVPSTGHLLSTLPGTYKAIAIGISTGGPETLAQLLPEIAGRTQAPIFIVQHILNGLSRYMAESLSRRVRYEIAEAQEDMAVLPGGIYLAQSGSHMLLRRKDGKITMDHRYSQPL